MAEADQDRQAIKAEFCTNGLMAHLEPLRLSFLLRSVYDQLPSPANLC